MRITSDADGKILIGLLAIGKGRYAEKCGEMQLLTAMIGHETVIGHNTDGKPLVDGYHISISHTIGYVTIILSRVYEVGIDIEYVSKRVSRIASRFLRPDEPFADIRTQLVAWCAKETAYKLFSAEHLGYQEMKVNVETREVTDLKNNVTVGFVCEETPTYILTYSWA